MLIFLTLAALLGIATAAVAVRVLLQTLASLPRSNQDWIFY